MTMIVQNHPIEMILVGNIVTWWMSQTSVQIFVIIVGVLWKEELLEKNNI